MGVPMHIDRCTTCVGSCGLDCSLSEVLLEDALCSTILHCDNILLMLIFPCVLFVGRHLTRYMEILDIKRADSSSDSFIAAACQACKRRTRRRSQRGHRSVSRHSIVEEETSDGDLDGRNVNTMLLCQVAGVLSIVAVAGSVTARTLPIITGPSTNGSQAVVGWQHTSDDIHTTSRVSELAYMLVLCIVGLLQFFGVTYFCCWVFCPGEPLFAHTGENNLAAAIVVGTAQLSSGLFVASVLPPADQISRSSVMEIVGVLAPTPLVLALALMILAAWARLLGTFLPQGSIAETLGEQINKGNRIALPDAQSVKYGNIAGALAWSGPVLGLAGVLSRAILVVSLPALAVWAVVGGLLLMVGLALIHGMLSGCSQKRVKKALRCQDKKAEHNWGYALVSWALIISYSMIICSMLDPTSTPTSRMSNHDSAHWNRWELLWSHPIQVIFNLGAVTEPFSAANGLAWLISLLILSLSTKAWPLVCCWCRPQCSSPLVRDFVSDRVYSGCISFSGHALGLGLVFGAIFGSADFRGVDFVSQLQQAAESSSQNLPEVSSPEVKINETQIIYLHDSGSFATFVAVFETVIHFLSPQLIWMGLSVIMLVCGQLLQAKTLMQQSAVTAEDSDDDSDDEEGCFGSHNCNTLKELQNKDNFALGILDAGSNLGTAIVVAAVAGAQGLDGRDFEMGVVLFCLGIGALSLYVYLRASTHRRASVDCLGFSVQLAMESVAAAIVIAQGVGRGSSWSATKVAGQAGLGGSAIAFVDWLVVAGGAIVTSQVIVMHSAFPEVLALLEDERTRDPDVRSTENWIPALASGTVSVSLAILVAGILSPLH